MNHQGSAILGILVGVGLLVNAWCVSPGERNRPVAADQVLSPYARVGDEELAGAFRREMRKMDYPREGRGWSQDEEPDGKIVEGMRRELESRGSERWGVIGDRGTHVDFGSLDDAELLILLYGTPRDSVQRGAQEASYDAMMKAILSRGGEWDRLSQEWAWEGLERLSDGQLKALWVDAQRAREFGGNPQREADERVSQSSRSTW